jgi:predicted nucleic acid-binding protein
MELPTTEKMPPAAVVDACFVIGLCAKEDNKYTAAKAKLDDYANKGWQLFAPGILIGEVLFVLCRKLNDESALDSAEYALALSSFIALMNEIKPPPKGDSSLIQRADQIRNSYGCSRANDAIYLALAEQLTTDRKVELVTFDGGMKNHALKNTPSVDIALLPVLKS